jgi:hypothetical protein
MIQKIAGKFETRPVIGLDADRAGLVLAYCGFCAGTGAGCA